MPFMGHGVALPLLARENSVQRKKKYDRKRIFKERIKSIV